MVSKNKSKSKGFVFSMEATLSLILIGLMILSLQAPRSVSLKEVLIVQQENDLLKIWSIQGFDETQARNDVFDAFGANGEIIINNRGATLIGERIISSEGILLDPFLNEIKVNIIVKLD